MKRFIIGAIVGAAGVATYILYWVNQIDLGF